MFNKILTAAANTLALAQTRAEQEAGLHPIDPCQEPVEYAPDCSYCQEPGENHCMACKQCGCHIAAVDSVCYCCGWMPS